MKKVTNQNYTTALSELLLLSGQGQKNFLSILILLKEAKFPIKKIKSYYYFQIGRWDLELENNQLIKLPYERTKQAIIKSNELLKLDEFKNYNVIDLRINNRIITE